MTSQLLLPTMFIHDSIGVMNFPALESTDAQAQLVRAEITHEIRNPLTTINMAVELLKPMVDDDEAKKVLLAVIMRASQKINSLINELLLPGPEAVAMEGYSMQQVLDEALLMVADQILLKRIDVLREYDAPDYLKKGDKPGMKIALSNIILNAVDAMNKGGELNLSTRLIDGVYTIQVRDNGGGISAEHIKCMFSPGFTNKENGMGLGLALTHDILHANEVNYFVESEVGVSTTFALSFNEGQPVLLQQASPGQVIF